MRVRALRGVCIGVERHLGAGDVVDLEPAQVPFLTSIGAVEVVKDDPPPPAADEAPIETPAEGGEGAADSDPATSTDETAPTEPESKSKPGKAGKKEK